MAMTVGELREFLSDFDEECDVYVDDGGIEIRVEDETGKVIGRYEIGGIRDTTEEQE
jgi:pyruvate kinase